MVEQGVRLRDVGGVFGVDHTVMGQVPIVCYTCMPTWRFLAIQAR